MMAVLAPDLVMPEARDELADSIASGKNIFDLTERVFALVSAVIVQVLKQEETSNLRLWEFIYILLVFMRAIATRPDILRRFGYALHAELLAGYLNKLLHTETRGGSKWDMASKLVSPTLRSPLNKKEKPGKYGVTTSNQATTDADTAQDATHSTEPINYTSPLPEHYLIRGSYFAREPGSYWPTTGEVVEQVRTESPANSYQKKREAELAGLQGMEREKALIRDPPLFGEDWFRDSKYDFEDRMVMRDSVQSIEMVEDRFNQILSLASCLVGSFFCLETNDDGYQAFGVIGALSVRELNPDVKMPEVFEREGGVRAVYVDPSLARYVAEVEEKDQKRELGNKNEKAVVNEVEAAGGMGTIVGGSTEVDSCFGVSQSDDSSGWTHLSNDSTVDALSDEDATAVMPPVKSSISHLFGWWGA